LLKTDSRAGVRCEYIVVYNDKPLVTVMLQQGEYTR
jgi:hypothetical protein